MTVDPAVVLTSLNVRVALAIGLLDRGLSELKELALDPALDAADRQTVKHHAEDCVGLGKKVLEILAQPSYREQRLAAIHRDACGGGGGGFGGSGP